jgi:hypothetical protein
VNESLVAEGKCRNGQKGAVESVVANTLAAVPALPHIERTFTSAPRISLVVQSSSGELPSESAH